MHHTKTNGDIAELRVAAKYIEKGCTVSRPLTDHAPYDLIVDNGSELLKVQVKSRSIRNGCVSVQRYTSNKPYEEGDIDIFAVYCIDTGDIAELKWNDFETSDLNLRIEPTKNNQTKNIKFFEDYKI